MSAKEEQGWTTVAKTKKDTKSVAPVKGAHITAAAAAAAAINKDKATQEVKTHKKSEQASSVQRALQPPKKEEEEWTTVTKTKKETKAATAKAAELEKQPVKLKVEADSCARLPQVEKSIPLEAPVRVVVKNEEWTTVKSKKETKGTETKDVGESAERRKKKKSKNRGDDKDKDKEADATTANGTELATTSAENLSVSNDSGGGSSNNSSSSQTKAVAKSSEEEWTTVAKNKKDSKASKGKAIEKSPAKVIDESSAKEEENKPVHEEKKEAEGNSKEDNSASIDSSSEEGERTAAATAAAVPALAQEETEQEEAEEAEAEMKRPVSLGAYAALSVGEDGEEWVTVAKPSKKENKLHAAKGRGAGVKEKLERKENSETLPASSGPKITMEDNNARLQQPIGSVDMTSVVGPYAPLKAWHENPVLPTSKHLRMELADACPVGIFLSLQKAQRPGMKQSYFRAQEMPPFYQKRSYLPLHWGQRKLLLSEVMFLNFALDNLEDERLLVYAGAAHGSHLLYLVKLFPNLYFDCYDPASFCPKLVAYSQTPGAHVRLFMNEDGWFDDKVAAKYLPGGEHYVFHNMATRKLLFVSDIRDIKDPLAGKTKHNAIIKSGEFMHKAKDEMKMQCDWTKIMKPELTMLKFKLPYPAENGPAFEQYLKGDVYFQCWAPTPSSETRLLIYKEQLEEDDGMAVWNVPYYTGKVDYFNAALRTTDFSDALLSDIGIVGPPLPPPPEFYRAKLFPTSAAVSLTAAAASSSSVDATASATSTSSPAAISAAAAAAAAAATTTTAVVDNDVASATTSFGDASDASPDSTSSATTATANDIDSNMASTPASAAAAAASDPTNASTTNDSGTLADVWQGFGLKILNVDAYIETVVWADYIRNLEKVPVTVERLRTKIVQATSVVGGSHDIKTAFNANLNFQRKTENATDYGTQVSPKMVKDIQEYARHYVPVTSWEGLPHKTPPKNNKTSTTRSPW